MKFLKYGLFNILCLPLYLKLNRSEEITESDKTKNEKLLTLSNLHLLSFIVRLIKYV